MGGADDRVGDRSRGRRTAKSLPANTDYRVSIVNAAGKKSYPISSFTWLLVARNQTDAAKGKKLVDFLKWYLHDGEKSAAALLYAPLPPRDGEDARPAGRRDQGGVEVTPSAGRPTSQCGRPAA